ncbi:MAG TPA: hypothetical protein VMU39_15250 [Solirubrobacteraceae bacterium]|nr:hypothetical protein [Solirubrobacteraceae bacterium]
MCPFSVTVPNVPDRDLGPLLTQLSHAGFDSPIITLLGVDGAFEAADARASRRTIDLPDDWRLLREREGESYRWPNGRDRYARYRVFIGTTRAEGAVQIGLGETIRENKWGRDRKYIVAFLSGGSPQQPLVEFVAADNYQQTHELVAVIRGSDGGRRMYGAADVLPTVYAGRFHTETYNDRVNHPGAWTKIAVVAREDDDQTILNHALIQSRRRHRA